MNDSFEIKALSKADAALLDQVELLWKDFYDGMTDQGMLLPLVEGGESLWRRGIEASLGRTNHLVVAHVNTEVLGFALGTLRIAPEFLGGHLVGFVSGLYVRPEARKLKVGTRLNESLEEWFDKRKAHSFELQVVIGNKEAIKFWEHLGYRGELHQMRKKPGNIE